MRLHPMSLLKPLILFQMFQSLPANQTSALCGFFFFSFSFLQVGISDHFHGKLLIFNLDFVRYQLLDCFSPGTIFGVFKILTQITPSPPFHLHAT